MQSKIYYTYKADGEWEKRDGNNAKLYQGQVAATTYYLTVTEESGENWLPSDRVYIVFSRPENPLSSVERRMDYDDVNKWWYIVSDGWETDVDIADNVDSVPLRVSFVARRYSTTGNPVLITTRTTGYYTETIYKSGTFYPQEIQESTVVEYIESKLDEHSERLDTIDGQIVDLDERIAIAEGAANSFTFYKQLSDISGINPATVTPVELATAMATNSILATEITAEDAPNLFPGGLTTAGSLFVRKSGADSIVFNFDAKVPETTTIYHYTGNVRLSDTSNQWSEWSDSSDANLGYDKVITNDAEFYELMVSPTWLDAVSVAFIGNFVRHSEISIPSTVKRIDGFNATISFINIGENSTGLLRYEQQPVDHDCSISGITLYCSRDPIESWEIYADAEIVAFANFINISNCKASFVGEGSFVAFKNCDGGGNLYAKNLRNDETIGIVNCSSRLYVDCKNMHDCYGDAYSYGGMSYFGAARDVYYDAHALIFKNCENMTNIGGTSTADCGIGTIDYSAFNSAQCCYGCKNINNIKATVTGTDVSDYACGVALCENVSNVNIVVTCLGDYGYAIGVYTGYNISNCIVDVTVPVGSERQAYDYYRIRRASNCYPLLSDDNWGGFYVDIDPSAGGEYVPWKPNGSDSFIDEGKIRELYLPEIANTDAVTGVKGNAEETYRIGDVNITADNVGAVALTGTQTVAGDKTFTGTLTVATPTADEHAATKGYVDALYGSSGTAELLAVNWSEGTYTLTVAALGTADAIFITPSTAADKANIEAAKFFVSASGTTVTITAETAPNVDIDIDYFITRGKANE